MRFRLGLGVGDNHRSSAVLLQRLLPPAFSRCVRVSSHRAMAPKGRQGDSKAVLKQQLKDLKTSRNEHKERADALGRFAKVIANKVNTNKHVRELFDDVKKLYTRSCDASTQTKPTSLGRLQRLSELPAVVQVVGAPLVAGAPETPMGSDSSSSA